MLDRDTYVQLLGQVDELISAFEQYPDEATRERLFALLTGLDLIHREGIQRLIEFIRESGGGNLVDRAAASDPIIKMLLGLYDLAELEIPERQQSAGFVPLAVLTEAGKNQS
jgi:hypothetical protein